MRKLLITVPRSVRVTRLHKRNREVETYIFKCLSESLKAYVTAAQCSC